MSFLFCQFQSWLAVALEDWSNVPSEVHSIVGWNPSILHALNTLVSFDNWFQFFNHETWKRRHRSIETLCTFSVGKVSATKFVCKHFHWTLVRHKQTAIGLGATRSAGLSSADLVAPRPIAVCLRRTNVQRKCLHTILLAKTLPTEKVLAKYCAVSERCELVWCCCCNQPRTECWFSWVSQKDVVSSGVFSVRRWDLPSLKLGSTVLVTY